MDVAAWLRDLGLGQYETVFRENAVDASVLPDLTAEDLREIGVAAIGHRRKLLVATAALRAPSTSDDAVTPAPKPEAAIQPPALLPDPEQEIGSAERRQVTVLFCDLAGSTALSGRLDPEDLGEVMAAYHRAATDAVRRHGGYVAKFLGDGVLVYFGWPQAHEDDAERALRAGLAAADAVAGLRSAAGPLAARVGIATGLVVVGGLLGEGSARERGVVGETPNLAARLQSLAEPGAVVADARTRRLTGAMFNWANLGETELKGISGPVQAWRALGESGIESRFEALRARDAAQLPPIGREEELELLLRRWHRARAGQGQVVLLRGEAGIGKSRLTAALQEALQSEEHEGLVLYCSPQHVDSPLHPVIARLERAAGLVPGDPPESLLAKLEALLTPQHPSPEDVALVAELLSVPTLGRWPSLDLSPQRRRERLLQALLRRVRALATRRSMLVVVEDAHWADPTTRELLDLLVAEVAGMAVLLLVTHRLEFDPGAWIGQSQVSVMQLNRLASVEHRALLRRVAGKALPAEVEAAILAHTDGVPLFVEEVTRAVLEGGLLQEEAGRWVLNGELPPLAVPASLQASLVARLDRLSAVREVAQAGAVLGREFAHDLLAAVAGLPEAALCEALDRLAAADLIQRRGTPPDALYAFRHALIQDAAHATMLRERRRELHAQAAEAIGRLRPEAAEREPHVLAGHHAEAGATGAAIGFWLKAAELAQIRGSNAEAAAALARGLALVPQVPDRAEGMRHEVDLRLQRGRVLFVSRGYGPPEAGEELRRALELAEVAGDEGRRFQVLCSYWTHLQVSGRLREAGEVADRVLSLAETRHDAAGRLQGHLFKGLGLLSTGRPVEAEAELRAAAACLPLVDRRKDLLATGFNAALGAEAYLSITALHRGKPESALALARKAVEVAHGYGQPFGMAFGFATLVRCAAWVGDAGQWRAWQRAGSELAEEKGFPYFQHLFRLHGRMLDAREGAADQSCSGLLEEFVALRRVAGDWISVVHGHVLAETLVICGHHREAAAHIRDLLALATASGEGDVRTDLIRLQGVLATISGENASAERGLGEALATARAQGSKWWELRAARDLARLWRDQGRTEEARNLLAPVYASFVEGFAFPDLVKARALLDEFDQAVAGAQAVRASAPTPMRKIIDPG